MSDGRPLAASCPQLRATGHPSRITCAPPAPDPPQDSNVISNNLTTPYQRVMLDSVFGGNSSHRPKFNLIMAEAIHPWLSLEEYLDAEEKEMELQQVRHN